MTAYRITINMSGSATISGAGVIIGNARLKSVLNQTPQELLEEDIRELQDEVLELQEENRLLQERIAELEFLFELKN